MSREYDEATAVNAVYKANAANWQYLKESYLGGAVYKAGKHLTKYINEEENDYINRLNSTPLDNHCSSVVSVYNSFLFREEPTREYGSVATLPETEAFLKDSDLDGRTLNNFMKEVSTWSSVYGHTWVIMAKPNTNANTRADELAQEVRPYVSLMTPLTVLDWEFTRQDNGLYVLTRLKYIEGTTGNVQTIKEWTQIDIMTYTVDTDKEDLLTVQVEVNELNRIPAVIAYNKRSITPGTGFSDLGDIANAQKFIYNLNSEIEQSVRIDGHPSLVKTAETLASAGAGSIITMPDDMDPALKPYMLDFNGANISSILATITATVDSIDKMANTGAVRATESKTLSGVAMQTEFQLLNAKLAEKADNLEQAEEELWRLFALYLDKAWDGEIDYPGSFNIQDTQNEYSQLQTAGSATTNPQVHALIDRKIVELLGEDPDTILTVTTVTDQNQS